MQRALTLSGHLTPVTQAVADALEAAGVTQVVKPLLIHKMGGGGEGGREGTSVTPRRAFQCHFLKLYETAHRSLHFVASLVQFLYGHGLAWSCLVLFVTDVL